MEKPDLDRSPSLVAETKKVDPKELIAEIVSIINQRLRTGEPHLFREDSGGLQVLKSN